MKTRTGALLVLWLVIAVVMTACGSSGGGGGGTTAATTTPVVAQGVMLKGSAIVNGIRFEDTLANITADDTAKTPAFLQDGMVVKVKGKRNDDGLSGTADRIEVENEVRGSIVSKSTDTFTVLGQTVQVSGATIFANVANYAALRQNDLVEVHGLRDASGVIQASRVELITGISGVDEVRGVVTGLSGTLPNAAAFSISGLAIVTDGSTTIVPAGSTVANGTLVEVHLSGNTATRIEVEDAEDADLRPGQNQEFEVEGYVSLFTGPTATFLVNGQVVSLRSDVRYENGIASDLGNGSKVEAEGHLSGSVLVAYKITFKENVRIEAAADGNGSLNVLGLTVVAASNADLSGLGPISGIQSGDSLRIRGFKNLDNSVTATRIDSGGGGGGDPRLQGPVTNIVNTASEKSFVILGIKITTSGATIARPNDDDGSGDQAISLSAFFSQLTENRSVVKARGLFTAGSPSTIAADEVEIE